jgi:cholesterol transport system auxiliary component
MTHWGKLLQVSPVRRALSTFRAASAGMKRDHAQMFRCAARVAAAFAFLSVAACGGGPPATFDLSAVQFDGVRASGGQLAIYEPSAATPLNSERIVMRIGPDNVAYLKGAQWADRLPTMLQTRLIESFQNSHALRAVGRPGLVADYSLQTDIRHFEADVQQRRAHVEIAVKIVTAGGRSVASKIVAAEMPAAKDDAVSVTSALDEALADVLRQIVLWALPKVGKG